MAEQLKINAELNTSQLKSESKKTANEVKQDLKSTEMQAKQTSDAIDGIGASASNAASGASQLKTSYGSALDAIEAKAKAAKNSLRQMELISMGAGLVGTAAGLLGKTEWGQSGTGSAVTGAMSGAASGTMMGMSVGSMIAPGIGTALGAAAGALTGAAAGLIQAANAQKEAAVKLAGGASGRYEVLRDQMDTEQSTAAWQARLQNWSDNWENPGAQKGMARVLEEMRGQQTAGQTRIDELTAQANAAYEDLLHSSDRDRAKNAAELDEITSKLIQARREQAEREAKISDLLRLQEKKEQEKDEIIDEILGDIEKDAAAIKAKTARDEAEAKKAQAADAAITKSFDTAAMQSEINNNQEDVKQYESLLSEYGNRGAKISDSLVRVGGGGSYAGVNNAINSNVAKIVSRLDDLLKTAKENLKAVQSDLNNYDFRLNNGTWA